MGQRAAIVGAHPGWAAGSRGGQPLGGNSGEALDVTSRADEALVLSVPETVEALYLVPTTRPPADIAALIPPDAAHRWPGRLGTMVAGIIRESAVPAHVERMSEVPPLPLDLIAAMGASHQQVERITTATHIVVISIAGRPGWPPVHEWVTRAFATIIAERLDSDVIDILNYQSLTANRAMQTLPDANEEVLFADWLTVDYSPDTSGYWCTTTGLRRFGLPELQTLATPPNVVEAWGRALTGIAVRLLATWIEALAADRGAAFVELPAQLTVRASDVAMAYGSAPPDAAEADASPAATVRLSLDPGEHPGQHAFLTVHPPLDWSGSAGEHMAEVCATLFGPPASVIRHAMPSTAMDRAIATARSGLNEIRGRFTAGDFDPHTKLLVKYGVTTPHGIEYVWAYVTSWHDPRRILATSAVDAVYEATVRSGRPVVVDVASVVDWAVEHDRWGIVEGGWTQAVLEDEERTD